MITNLKLVLTSLSLKTKSCDVLFDSLSLSIGCKLGIAFGKCFLPCMSHELE